MEAVITVGPVTKDGNRPWKITDGSGTLNHQLETFDNAKGNAARDLQGTRAKVTYTVKEKPSADGTRTFKNFYLDTIEGLTSNDPLFAENVTGIAGTPVAAPAQPQEPTPVVQTSDGPDWDKKDLMIVRQTSWKVAGSLMAGTVTAAMSAKQVYEHVAPLAKAIELGIYQNFKQTWNQTVSRGDPEDLPFS